MEETHVATNEHNLGTEHDWTDFTPPAQIAITHPWVARYCPASSLLQRENSPVGTDTVSTKSKEVYGNPTNPILFSVSNGGMGDTRVLKGVCTKFIRANGNDFRIAWIANHSRHSQIALLADIVQVAVTYEPKWEMIAEQEGWARRVAAPAFWDHFVIAGPQANHAGLTAGMGLHDALRTIAAQKSPRVRWHSRGDGSATFTRESALWAAAGVDLQGSKWVETHVLTPYLACERASAHSAYLLTDRSTLLTAKRDGVAPDLVVYVEGGEELLNPGSASVNILVPDSPAQRMAVRFAEYLNGNAQWTLRGWGRVWEHGHALFTGQDQKEFAKHELLVGKLF